MNTIAEMVVEIADSIAAKHGTDYIITTAEWNSIVAANGINPKSAYPTDYCYNRINAGVISLERPALFEYISRGKFYCRGSRYSYCGDIYQKPVGSNEDIKVGYCDKGVRMLYN